MYDKLQKDSCKSKMLANSSASLHFC